MGRWYGKRRATIAFLMLAGGMGLALQQEDANRVSDVRAARRADVQLCVAFDVLKANILAALLAFERDYPPPGKEREFSQTIRGLVDQFQIVDCGKLVGGEKVRIVVTIPPPPTVTSLP